MEKYGGENTILNQTFEFSLLIIAYCEVLQELKKYNMANQLFRSGTSIGANVSEAQNAESRADFVHKIKIAAKEAEETRYWLALCQGSKNYPPCDDLIARTYSINKIL